MNLGAKFQSFVMHVYDFCVGNKNDSWKTMFRELESLKIFSAFWQRINACPTCCFEAKVHVIIYALSEPGKNDDFRFILLLYVALYVHIFVCDFESN